MRIRLILHHTMYWVRCDRLEDDVGYHFSPPTRNATPLSSITTARWKMSSRSASFPSPTSMSYLSIRPALPHRVVFPLQLHGIELRSLQSCYVNCLMKLHYITSCRVVALTTFPISPPQVPREIEISSRRADKYPHFAGRPNLQSSSLNARSRGRFNCMHFIALR